MATEISSSRRTLIKIVTTLTFAILLVSFLLRVGVLPETLSNPIFELVSPVTYPFTSLNDSFEPITRYNFKNVSIQRFFKSGRMKEALLTETYYFPGPHRVQMVVRRAMYAIITGSKGGKLSKDFFCRSGSQTLAELGLESEGDPVVGFAFEFRMKNSPKVYEYSCNE